MVDKHEQQQAVSAKAAEDLRKTMDAAKEKAANDVDARLAAKEKSVKEYYERMENVQPTPTQRENDLAKVGALDIDEKEDDGSEWEDEHIRRVTLEKLDNPYAPTVAADAPHAGRQRKGGRKGSKK
jgi:hypothetical protein